MLDFVAFTREIGLHPFHSLLSYDDYDARCVCPSIPLAFYR